ncbi:uncharacterized protein LOC113231463 [Hyposmocoma kahamanoa]|uniref:uncharacterized protein LOC113231463 n=1 Tax=Hyposmocoma kahamanoa TaxID=1477025 RepID=UPI000E6D73FA|nr:uncharacterized protein LOC113231463 [Hyposmocoma kahamanoa]
MNYAASILVAMISTLSFTSGQDCNLDACPKGNVELACGFDFEDKTYTMFPNKCAMKEYIRCFETVYIQTPLEFCVKYHNRQLISRRSEEDSCPVFCANYYRPVCGANTIRSYVYRSFRNQCHMDMLNCRGDDDIESYVEVPLEHCERHAMKNYFKDNIYIEGARNIKYYD